MTSQKAQIQALIQQIDGVLSKASPRLPWVMAGDFDQQRQVLEDTRRYLSDLEHQLATSEGYPLPNPNPPGYTFPPPGPAPMGQASAESAQQVLQAVLQEMTYLRTNVMQKMRGDIDELQQRRETLAQEIRLLESQRQQYLSPSYATNQQQIITEFLQTLMGRLQENLTGQVAQMMMNLEAEARSDRSLLGTGETSPPYDGYPTLTPSQRLQHLQMVQAQSDQLALKLDSTLQVIFDSLQKNVQSYQDSLSRGLDKMHSLGQQGEAMFSALVNRLAQQLGRDASAYLQSSMQSADWDLSQTYLNPLDSGLTEFTATGQAPLSPPQANEVSDEQINQLLNQLNPDPARSSAPPSPAASVPPASLPALDLDLNQVNLEEDAFFNLPEEVEELTLFQVDEEQLDDNAIATDDEDVTRIQDSDVTDSTALTGADSDDNLESALALLNQLNEDVQAGRTDAEQDVITSPESMYEELDGLYESLFGDGNGTEEPPSASLSEDELADAMADTVPFDLEGAATDPAMADALINEELFAGTTDPAITTPAAEDSVEAPADAASDESSNPSEQPEADFTAADFLFGADAFDSDEEALIGDIELLEEEEDSSADTNRSTSEAVPDTIASLTELIEDEQSPIADMSDVEATSPVVPTSEDAFEPAAPNETLLISEDLSSAAPVDFQLTEDALNQLTQDLHSLEELDPDAFAAAVVEADSAENPNASRDALNELLSELTSDHSDVETTNDSEETLLLDNDGTELTLDSPVDERPQPDALNRPVDDVISFEDDLDALLNESIATEESAGDDTSGYLDDLFSESEPDGAESVQASEMRSDDALPEDFFSSIDDSINTAPANHPPVFEDEFDDDEDTLIADPAESQATSYAAPPPAMPLDMSGIHSIEDLFTSPEPTAVTETPLTPQPNERDMLSSLSDLLADDEEDFASSPPPSADADLFDDEQFAPPDSDRPTDAATSAPSAPTLGDEYDDTIDDLFVQDETSAADNTPLSTLEELMGMGQYAASEVDESDSNAFTLEGLGSLFEDLPDVEPTVYPIANPNSDQPATNFTLENAFEDAKSEPQENWPSDSEKKSP